jgi:2-oxo-4-hydroxy-4-carboxy-5-ureidoimidazoline decarboxylase
VSDAAGDGARAAFLARVGHVAEHSPWVAEEAFARGPFVDAEAVVRAFEQVVRGASRERRLALVRAHPDLAGRAAVAGELTADSAREQASAGLDRMSPEEFARFGRLNDAYRARFGFPFVICVREHTRASILDAYEERLRNDADEELETAAEEVAKIVALRLREALADGQPPA